MENDYESLLYKIILKIESLEKEQRKLESAHKKWLKIDKQLERLEGSIQMIEHIAFDKKLNLINKDIEENIIKFPIP